jgi:energy-coupling factor transporter ATP-binding protein EcfA2
MKLGDLLLSAKLVTQADLDEAAARQQEQGGTLAEQLVAIGALSAELLQRAINQIPAEPVSFADTGITATELMTLLIKLIHTSRLETVVQFIDAIKLPPHLVEGLVQGAISRNLMVALGTNGNTMRYELSEQGRNWAQEALKASLYAGPAPVTLHDFCTRVELQKVTSEAVTFGNIRNALQGYSITDEFIKQIGPALNSGRTMLLYGPPGNGKTSIAQSFADVFNSTIYVPYSVMIDGQIMRVYDPSLHTKIEKTQTSIFSGLRREQSDARWVAIRRPFIVTGGELTLEMLDLRYDSQTGFYEAPLHIKALGGCFVVDDFGRQIVSPTTLLNRWIVPMESRVDYLKLHTGKSFSIPFEALVIFSTNIDPEDLMDPAFLRRLPYKIEVGAPSLETYVSIFQGVCKKSGVPLTQEGLQTIVHKVTVEKGLELAAYHARFIIDQVVAIARFMDVPPQLDAASIDYALRNLKIRKQTGTN